MVSMGICSITLTNGWERKGHRNFFPFLMLLKSLLSLSKVEGTVFEEVSCPAMQVTKQRLDWLDGYWVDIQV